MKEGRGRERQSEDEPAHWYAAQVAALRGGKQDTSSFCSDVYFMYASQIHCTGFDAIIIALLNAAINIAIYIVLSLQ